MPIVSRVGRRSRKLRLALLLIYVALGVGAATMLYPLAPNTYKPRNVVSLQRRWFCPLLPACAVPLAASAIAQITMARLQFLFIACSFYLPMKSGSAHT